jgi:hypothetical protein
VLFMTLKLSRGISNCVTILHQYASNICVGCITIHIKRLLNVGISQHRCCGEELLHSEKSFFALRAPFELGMIIGLAILQKIGMNRQ